MEDSNQDRAFPSPSVSRPAPSPRRLPGVSARPARSSLPLLPHALAGLNSFQAWRNSSALLALLGFTSAAFLAVFDLHLWQHAPSHGYALLGFIQGDLAVLFLLTARPRWGSRLVWIWGALQAGLMATDILTAPQLGLTYEHLFRDTWGFWGFDLLFGVRVLQALHFKLLPRPWLGP